MTSTPESRLSVCLLFLLAVGCAVNAVLKAEVKAPTTPLEQVAKPLSSNAAVISEQPIVSYSNALLGEDDAPEQQSKLIATQQSSDSRSAKNQPSYSESLATAAETRETPTLQAKFASDIWW